MAAGFGTTAAFLGTTALATWGFEVTGRGTLAGVASFATGAGGLAATGDTLATAAAGAGLGTDDTVGTEAGAGPADWGTSGAKTSAGIPSRPVGTATAPEAAATTGAPGRGELATVGVFLGVGSLEITSVWLPVPLSSN